MEKINSKDNIRLALVVLFSVITLSLWNGFIAQKQQEKQLIKEKVVYENKTEAKSLFSGKNNELQNISEDLNSRKSCIDLKESQEFNALKESSLVYDLKNKAHYDFDFNLCNINSSQKAGVISHNSIEFKKEDKDLFSFKMKSDGTVNNSVYTFNFLKKEFHDIIYVNEKNETQRLDVSKVKKDQELSFVDFFGISSNYFNFSVIKKDNKKIKIKITESETDVYLHIIATGELGSDSLFYVFAGGKDLNLLKRYSKRFEIPRFEGVLDLGFFSIIAKPILILLDKVNQYINNFTISIILATLILKLITIPLLNSSFASSQKMKLISPKITQLKERYKDDKMQMNKEMMALYKEYKINPLSAMFPMLIQIPILFAFYKVLSNAFYLYGAKGVFWISDLSAPEGLSVFNVFGLLPFTPPDFLMIGPMSILMGASTWLQQKLSANEGMDDSQKSLMMMMPVFLLFISTSFPAGLLVYWIFSNIFAILHQYCYNLFHKPKGLVKL